MKFDHTLNYYLTKLPFDYVLQEEVYHELGEKAYQGLKSVSLLPMDEAVLFPGIILHFKIRKAWTRQLELLIEQKKNIGIIAIKNTDKSYYKDNLHPIGTLASIHKVLTMPDSNHDIIIVQGKERFELKELIKDSAPLLKAKVQLLPSKPAPHSRAQALLESIKEATIELFSHLNDIPAESRMIIENITDLSFLTSYIATNLGEFKEKQALLVTKSDLQRATLLLKQIRKKLEIARIKTKIKRQVNASIAQKNRDHILREQIKVMQEELGDSDDSEVEALLSKGYKKKWPEEVQEQFLKTLRRAERNSPQSPEYGSLINYAHTLLELPWGIYTRDKKDLQKTQQILDKNHYAMEKVKERILEYLAVQQLKKGEQKMILCLLGPPGVGKTTLCRSIAQALGRKFIKISLAGVHDESEIRGNRRVYLGSKVGKILDFIQKARSSNPVFVLDEIDKTTKRHGDPAAALLELLDPAQHHEFLDNFLEVPYDLSQVLFIATANNPYDIPGPLADRMEFIELSGYALEEKVEIAHRHLFPEIRKAHGLKHNEVQLSLELLKTITQQYTMEAGVRELSRQLSKVCRKIAKKKVLKEPFQKVITANELPKLLGQPKYIPEDYQKIKQAGVAIGLAWTSVGGAILFIEAELTPGEGKLTLSGQLGEVMEESAMAAYTYLKAKAINLKINPLIFKKYDLHIHIPDGATPKDGPSAGIALFTALASLYTQRKIKERLAMTGEITLRGTVLPVGGIKEKLLAAKRAGITQIILCKENKKDLLEIQEKYLEAINVHYISDVSELLPLALEAEKIETARKFTLTTRSPKK